MADLIDRAALLECIDKKFFATDPDGEEQLGYLNSRTLIRTAPAVDAVACNILRRVIYSETARLYRADEKMIEAIAGYNPSSFFAGYQYAIDCITNKLSLLQRERKET